MGGRTLSFKKTKTMWLVFEKYISPSTTPADSEAHSCSGLKSRLLDPTTGGPRVAPPAPPWPTPARRRHPPRRAPPPWPRQPAAGRQLSSADTCYGWAKNHRYVDITLILLWVGEGGGIPPPAAARAPMVGAPQSLRRCRAASAAGRRRRYRSGCIPARPRGRLNHGHARPLRWLHGF